VFRTRPYLAVAATIGALSLAAAACGSSSSPTSANPPATASATSGPAADTVTAIADLSGQGTTVDLDAHTLAALTALGVSPAPYGSAHLDGTAITFPITSGYAEIHSDRNFRPGYVVGSIEHDGSGLTLTKGSTVVTAADFVVDPGNSVLYATVNGKPGVPLASLDGTALQISEPNGSVHLDGTVVKLTAAAATALDQAFSTTAIPAGLPLGVAHIVATGPATTYTDHTTEISRLSGTSTSVVLDPATLSALTSLGVAPAPVGSATLNGSTVTFPITGGFAAIHSDKSAKPGYVDGVVLHQGSGLSFTKGSTVVTATDFVVDPGTSILYATVGSQARVPLFFLDGSNLAVSSVGGAVHLDGTVVKLTPQAATALDQAFATTALTPYATVGVAHIVAAG